MLSKPAAINRLGLASMCQIDLSCANTGA